MRPSKFPFAQMRVTSRRVFHLTAWVDADIHATFRGALLSSAKGLFAYANFRLCRV